MQDELPTWRGHNEQAMALAGVAYAKAKRRRQIMIATSSIGPGSTNMVTAAAVAHANRLPLLLFSGDYFAHRIVDPVLQQVEHFGDPTVRCRRLQAGDPLLGPHHPAGADRPVAAPGAGGDARPGRLRPAFFALPQDIQAEAYDYPAQFFDRKVHYVRRPGPDPRDVAQGRRADRRRAKPMIIAGGGVHYSGAVAELTAFAERRSIPVVETVAGKATLVADHPNYAGPIGVTGSAAANAVAEDADVVIAVGHPPPGLHHRLVVGVPEPGVRFVSINTARWDATKQQAQPVIGDAQVSLERSTPAWATTGPTRPGWRTPSSRSPSGTPTSTGGRTATTSSRRPTPRSSRRSTSCATTDDYCLSAAGGLPGELTMGWRSKAVGTFDSEYGYSTMGYEIAGAWGAKMARGDGDVIAGWATGRT